MIGWRNPFCALRTLWRTLVSNRLFDPPLVPVSGHDYVTAETVKNATVEVLRCETCGHVSVGWRRG